MEVKQYSEDSLTVNLGSEIDEKINKQLVQLKSAVTELNLEGITDIVLSYTSLIIYFDVLKADSKK
ncbi:carboxyltransferase domain-containing protein [Jeotgalicoccus nanhaiensis]|nr:carboxyltransferase domain-containing protein [Jeotgalicoccus nanhaiensis]